jgi:hypothetical protein
MLPTRNTCPADMSNLPVYLLGGRALPQKRGRRAAGGSETPEREAFDGAGPQGRSVHKRWQALSALACVCICTVGIQMLGVWKIGRH